MASKKTVIFARKVCAMVANTILKVVFLKRRTGSERFLKVLTSQKGEASGAVLTIRCEWGDLVLDVFLSF